MFRTKHFRRNLHRRPRVEEFEPRLNLSAISFISHDITTAEAIYRVYPSDVDGDGDLDVLSASKSLPRGGNLAWYENTNGKGNFGQQQVISTELGRPVRAVDIDGDGDDDVVSAFHDTISWYENTDGNGNFGERRVITTTAIGVNGVDAADVDGDGDNDVLLALYGDDKVTWYENTDGKGTFGEQQVVTKNAGGSKSLHVGDIDGDGDLDVLATSSWGSKLAWYENTDGKGVFGAPQAVNLQHSWKATGTTTAYSTSSIS